MNLLLDTHVALWAITDDERLSAMARELIQSPRNAVWISAVSVWEIAIKHALSRETMQYPAKKYSDISARLAIYSSPSSPSMGRRLKT